MCRSQPSQAGQTCIQSAYQLVISTVVKKEQKAMLEAKKSVLHNSTLASKRLFHTLRRKSHVKGEEIQKKVL